MMGHVYTQNESNQIKGEKAYYFKSKTDFFKNENSDTAFFEIVKQNNFYYKIKPFYDDIQQKQIRREIFGLITNNDTLINLFLVNNKLPSMYSKLIMQDSFCIVHYPTDNSGTILTFGLLGGVIGAVTSSAATSVSTKNNPLIFTLNSPKTYELTKSNLKINLGRLDDKSILDSFKNEKNYDLDTLIKYFILFMKYKSK